MTEIQTLKVKSLAASCLKIASKKNNQLLIEKIKGISEELKQTAPNVQQAIMQLEYPVDYDKRIIQQIRIEETYNALEFLCQKGFAETVVAIAHMELAALKKEFKREALLIFFYSPEEHRTNIRQCTEGINAAIEYHCENTDFKTLFRTNDTTDLAGDSGTLYLE